jgi:hypothetical protein
MIKKALIHIALNTNLLVMDFSRNMSINDLLISAKNTGAARTDLSGDHTSLK